MAIEEKDDESGALSKDLGMPEEDIDESENY